MALRRAPTADPGTLLGRGIYDVAEISHLVGRSTYEVSTWSRPTADYAALLLPRRGGLFTFYDLITANVTAELRRRGVKLAEIRRSRSYLADDLKVDWPLAHAVGLNILSTVGTDVFVKKDEWVAAGKGGQRAFGDVIEPLIHRLTFDGDTEMANAWNPHDGVVIKPDVQAGAPCVEGTRISTQLIAELVEAGEHPEDVADDYDLAYPLVLHAVEFEHDLAA